MDILAHRGMSVDYPENTMPALKAACQEGFSLELDIHRTKDGALVVIHDSDIDRVTNTSGRVVEKGLDQLKALDNGSWFDNKFTDVKIATLDEICEMFLNTAKKNTVMAINIKDDSEKEIEKLVTNCIIKYKLQERSFVFDMGLESIRRFKAIDRSIRVAGRVSERDPWEEIKELDYIDIIWLDEFFGNFYTEDMIKDIHNHNKKVYAISPELHKLQGHPCSHNGYEKTWESLISWGIDGICTDYPSALLTLLQGRD